MLKSRSINTIAVALGAFAFLGLVLINGPRTPASVAAAVEPTPGPSQSTSMAASSIPTADLINPQDLAKILQEPKGEKPLLIYVGFQITYAQAHIPGSEYFGPAARPEALEQLRQHVEKLPRNRFIVIYCGCCPWSHCPNVEPAYAALHAMGFKKLKVLYLPNNLGMDWVYKGYPSEKGE
jgi:3-mercaptopyruvate sulfurtransferase SseA